MARSAATRRGATPAQLRSDIDSGRTADKVAAPDPAAAPLGTDDEAAGTPVDPQAAAAARRQETIRPRPLRADHGAAYGWLLMGFAAIVAAAIVGAAFLR